MSEIESFSPENCKMFVYRDVKFNAQTGELVMHFDLDDYEFEERLQFPAQEPVDPDGFNEAIKLLFLACGLSYYKLAAPKQIIIDRPITMQASQMLQALLMWGMAEFAYVNELPGLAPAFDIETIDANPSSTKLSDGVVVPVGGGKDSIVTLNAMKSTGADITLLGVRDFAPIANTAKVAELPLLTIDRTIDPLVAKLQAAGGYAGHVPATAVVSLIAIAAALQLGKRSVVMSNEASASEGNIVVEGLQVNHQYSKSRHFEAILKQVLGETVSTDLEWFSLLRPFSELTIAKRFAALTEYHKAFLSCNRAFVIDPAKRADTWCGKCAKCVFVYLALANFVSRNELNQIFGSDVLNNPENTALLGELCGVRDTKPFECVGEQRECRTALRELAKSDEWSSEVAINHVAAKIGGFEDPAFAHLLLRGENIAMIPDDWKAALDEVG